MDDLKEKIEKRILNFLDSQITELEDILEDDKKFDSWQKGQFTMHTWMPSLTVNENPVFSHSFKSNSILFFVIQNDNKFGLRYGLLTSIAPYDPYDVPTSDTLFDSKTNAPSAEMNMKAAKVWDLIVNIRKSQRRKMIEAVENGQLFKLNELLRDAGF